MFSALSTGLSGLVKIAQDKIIVGSEAEVATGNSETKNKTSNSEALQKIPSENIVESGSQTVDDAPKEDVEGKDAGDPILGAAKEWSNYLLGGVMDVTSKVTSGAANATGTITSGAMMIKKTVEDNTFLGEFNKEQEKFIDNRKEVSAATGAGLAPWTGYAEDEETLKDQILSLSADERHFLRPPPGGVAYQFDYEQSYPMALATLEADPTLRAMRFKLVPKRIKEEDFWRNYFYRVSLIKQSVALSAMGEEGEKEEDSKCQNDEEEEDIPEWEKELQRELQEYEVVGDEGAGDVVVDEPSQEWQEEIQKMIEQAE